MPELSDVLYDLVRLQTTGADLHGNYGSANHGLHCLDVRAPCAALPVLGMADGVAKGRALAARYRIVWTYRVSPFQ